MLNLVLTFVGVMNNMKINQYQIHYIYRMWFNGFKYINIPTFFFCAKFASL